MGTRGGPSLTYKEELQKSAKESSGQKVSRGEAERDSGDVANCPIGLA
jgi:hypothetical protein